MDAFLKETILEAGELAMDWFSRRDKMKVEYKSPKDLVTEADRNVEQFLKMHLLDEYPDFGFWGEESGEKEQKATRWIVDPIDGTHSFSRGQYFWGISVALEQDGEIVMGAVYAPALNDLYFAEKDRGAWKNEEPIEVSDIRNLSESMVSTGFACLRGKGGGSNNLNRFSRVARASMGQRRFGSAALDLCLVADGQVDGFWEQNLNLYDVAAGYLLVMEAGGRVSNFDGIDGLNPKQICASNSLIHPELIHFM